MHELLGPEGSQQFRDVGDVAGQRQFAVLLASLAIQACDRRAGSAAAQSTACVVERIAEGDTFTCRDGRRVRLIGIDAPELAQGESGRQARAALRRLAPPGAV